MLQSNPAISVSKRGSYLIADEFVVEPRGTIAVKGKGEIETWFLVGRKA